MDFVNRLTQGGAIRGAERESWTRTLGIGRTMEPRMYTLSHGTKMVQSNRGLGSKRCSRSRTASPESYHDSVRASRRSWVLV
jgi:hypothetical protein